MEIEGKRIAISAVSLLLTGLFVGGLVFGRAPTVRTLTETVEVVKEIEVERIVTVEKIIVKTEYLKADNAQIIETRHTDGSVTIDSRFYGLQIDSFDSSNESYKLDEKVESKEQVSAQSSQKVTVSSNSLSLHFYSPYSSILSFDYKTDWVLQYSRHILNSPFFGSVSVGPKQFSLGLGFTF
jgi:hypothetical protein